MDLGQTSYYILPLLRDALVFGHVSFSAASLVVGSLAQYDMFGNRKQKRSQTVTTVKLLIITEYEGGL
jgi:hypothetical protein